PEPVDDLGPEPVTQTEGIPPLPEPMGGNGHHAQLDDGFVREPMAIAPGEPVPIGDGTGWDDPTQPEFTGGQETPLPAPQSYDYSPAPGPLPTPDPPVITLHAPQERRREGVLGRLTLVKVSAAELRRAGGRLPSPEPVDPLEAPPREPVPSALAPEPASPPLELTLSPPEITPETPRSSVPSTGEAPPHAVSGEAIRASVPGQAE